MKLLLLHSGSCQTTVFALEATKGVAFIITSLSRGLRCFSCGLATFRLWCVIFHTRKFGMDKGLLTNHTSLQSSPLLPLSPVGGISKPGC